MIDVLRAKDKSPSEKEVSTKRSTTAVSGGRLKDRHYLLTVVGGDGGNLENVFEGSLVILKLLCHFRFYVFLPLS